MAAKLANLSDDNELLASKRFYKKLESKQALMTCGCPDGKVISLWEEKDVSDDDRFDFESVFRLGSNWCKKHGQKFCKEILKADE